MIRETPFLAYWRDVCPRLWLGEAIRLYRLATETGVVPFSAHAE